MIRAALGRGAGWSPLLSGAAALLVGLLLLAFSDVGWIGGAGAFVRGTFGSLADVAETAVAATPLLLCGLSVALSFRAGMFNIGAEGQLLVGMLAATWVGTRVAALGVVGALLIGAVAGGGLAAVAAWLRLRRRVPEVLATLLLNFVALYLVSLAVHGFLQERAATLPQSDRLDPGCLLPRIASGTRLHLGVLLALLAAVGYQVLLYRTRVGLRLRAAGASPRAAKIAGFPVERDLWLAFIGSGCLAGLAGAVEVSGVTRVLFEDPSPGFGYAGIAVALLGRLSGPGVVFAALFFGLLENGGGAVQRHAGVSAGFTQVLQGTAVFALLLFDAFASRWGKRPDVAEAAP